MQTLFVEILNHKSISILNDLADLELISFIKKEKNQKRNL
jgi:hypothetical protein